MKQLSKGPKILLVGLIAIYAVFVFWYGGNGKPMTPQEVDEIFARMAERAKTEANSDGHVRQRLRELAASDDGKEFFMLNLIRYRPKAIYPPGFHYDDDALAADARYSAAIMPYLLKHGGMPVFLGSPEGPFLREDGDTEWQRVAIVRYRSRRDLLEMCVDLAGQNIGMHKWASIEKTHVFPVRSLFNLFFVRGFVGVLLGLIGLVLHWVLRHASWYNSKK